MTYGYSLEMWNGSNIIEREAKLFNYLSEKHNYRFWLITYGDEKDLEFVKYFKNVEIIPMYCFFKKTKFKSINIVKSLYFPFKLVSLVGKKQIIIKQNQLLGAWVSIIFKLISRSLLFTRTGYDMYQYFG